MKKPASQYNACSGPSDQFKQTWIGFTGYISKIARYHAYVVIQRFMTDGILDAIIRRNLKPKLIEAGRNQFTGEKMKKT